MRVLQVMECTIGGTRRHLVDVCQGLVERGVELSVAASVRRQPDFERDLERLDQQGVRVHRVPMRREPSAIDDLRDLGTLERILREERPDVVHTHSSKAGVLGRLASLHQEIGWRVHTPHTFAFLFSGAFAPPVRALYREIERALCQRTQRVVAVSASEAASMTASGVVDEAQLAVVPNGIDPAPWLAAEPLARAQLGVPEGVPLLACVGLLNRGKGQDLLLEALADPGLEDVHAVLAGSGEDEPALRERCRAGGLEARVRFLGFRHDVPRIVAACDALVLPSRWEGLPYAALEAMAAGRCVVATPVDGARELVLERRTGFLADAIDAPALAGALARWRAAGPAVWERLGREGRARVLTGFTRRAMVDRLLSVYRELA